MTGVGGATDEVDVQVVGQAADEQRPAQDRQDAGGREQVVADRHEVDVRPGEEAEHAQLLEPAHRRPQVEDDAGHVQRREQADEQADHQTDAEALQLVVAHNVEHDAGEDAGQVRVDDDPERAVVAVAERQQDAGPLFALLAQTLVDQNVGVHRHTQHQHQPGEAR